MNSVNENKHKYMIMIALVLFCQAVPAQTLKQIVQQTINTSPEIQSEVYGRRAVDTTVDQAKSGYYPQVDINLGAGGAWVKKPATGRNSDTLARREAGFKYNQMLFDGYAVKSQVDRAESLVDAAAYNVGDVSERTAIETVTAFLNVLRNRELLTVSRENLSVHEQTSELVKLRSDQGVGRKVDYEQAQARLSQSNANEISAGKELHDAETRYIRVVGNAPEDLEQPEDICCELFPGSIEDAVKIGLATHPSLQSAIADHEAALSQINEAKSLLSPKVNNEIEGNYNYGQNGIDDRDENLLVMLRMRYNALNGGADRARIMETDFLSQEAYERAKQIQREIEFNIRTAWNDLETVQSNLPSLKAYADAAEKTRQAYRKEFEIGQRTLLDLLDTENEVFTARTDYINGLYDERLARFRLLSSMGKLLDSLEIEARQESLPAYSR